MDYIYKEQLLDLYGNLGIAFRMTPPVTVDSGERIFSALKHRTGFRDLLSLSSTTCRDL